MLEVQREEVGEVLCFLLALLSSALIAILG